MQQSRDFRRADFIGAGFTKADLIGADFTEANLRRANLSAADLTGARWDENTIWPEGIGVLARV